MVVRVRERLTYANVMATVAVFLALGGGAWAAFHSKGPVQKGIHIYRIHKALDEGQSTVVLWRKGAFKLVGTCFVPSQGTSTQASTAIVGKRDGMTVASTYTTENQTDPQSLFNDGADAGDTSGILVVTGTTVFPTIADANFGATIPRASGGAATTVTGNVVALARHGSPGHDCTFTGHVSSS